MIALERKTGKITVRIHDDFCTEASLCCLPHLSKIVNDFCKRQTSPMQAESRVPGPTLPVPQ